MSKADGKCNFCNRHAAVPKKVVYDDVIVCSEACDDAMSALLDGVSMEEVEAEWSVKTGLTLGGQK